MKHYAGLDVSVKETSICIVDEAGKCLSGIPVCGGAGIFRFARLGLGLNLCVALINEVPPQ